MIRDDCIQHFRRIYESNITRRTSLAAAALELWTANLEFILLTIQAPSHLFLDTCADKELSIIESDIITLPANHIEGLADIHRNSCATQSSC